MVKEWSPAFNYREAATNSSKVWSDYVAQCDPTRCFYFQKQELSLATKVSLLLAIFGGLASLLMPAAHGLMNGIIRIPKEDITDLHRQTHAEAVAKEAKLKRGLTRGMSTRKMGDGKGRGGSKVQPQRATPMTTL